MTSKWRRLLTQAAVRTCQLPDSRPHPLLRPLPLAHPSGSGPNHLHLHMRRHRSAQRQRYHKKHQHIPREVHAGHRQGFPHGGAPAAACRGGPTTRPRHQLPPARAARGDPQAWSAQRPLDVVHEQRAHHGPDDQPHRRVLRPGAGAVRSGMDVGEPRLETRYEWFFNVFEATLMLCNSWLWSVRHPRKYLPRSTRVCLSRARRSHRAGRAGV